ncbi:FAD-dependent monooxygenase [Actinomadura barringtoniae]|uniref:FAD-dependent monooxygenase n=1 Tax=Actinomadura barringtoniae TaxID=1427535 RepID=A0A939PJL4_9ACTN|nr:FAD-dependent monooxygenase [Actinomadura barringtoniae]MBO2453575.1 FAD-dependent monooxygenase [Actinomadura barringtoniae]
MNTTTPRIVIAGGGPVGLMLASELRLYGIETIVLERLTEIDRRTKAGGIQGRAAEMLDRRGLSDPLQEAHERFMASIKMNRPPHPGADKAGAPNTPAGSKALAPSGGNDGLGNAEGGSGEPDGRAGGETGGGPGGPDGGAGGSSGSAGGGEGHRGGPGGGVGGTSSGAGGLGGAMSGPGDRPDGSGGGLGGGTGEGVDGTGGAAGGTGGGPGGGVGGRVGRGGAAMAALMRRGHFAGIWALRESSYETAPGIFVPQHVLEQELERHAIALGVELRRGHAIVSYEQDGDGVTLHVEGPDGPYSLNAGWLVGADGGRSLVRKQGGFAFPGTDGIITGYQAVVELDDPEFVPRGWNRCPGGLMVNGPTPGRILCVEFDGPPADRDSEITLDELQAAVRRITGTTVTLSSPTSLTRFTDNARLADDYRSGRVLLAGDAAHVHSPFGGQGLNLGLGDAVNLGWKLALVARGEAQDELLDTYTAERRPIAERVLDNTRAQVALLQPGPHTDALREIFTRMLDFDDANAYLTDLMNGAGIRYELDSRTDAVGRSFAFDLTVNTAEGELRVADLMRSGRGLLIGDHDIAPWADRVDVVSGSSPKAPSCSLLIRPDGFVAWVTEEPTPLNEALTRWFGPGNH